LRPDGIMAIQYEKVVPLLVESIKEARNEPIENGVTLDKETTAQLSRPLQFYFLRFLKIFLINNHLKFNFNLNSN